jgi:hypothetical protein
MFNPVVHYKSSFKKNFSVYKGAFSRLYNQEKNSFSVRFPFSSGHFIEYVTKNMTTLKKGDKAPVFSIRSRR